MSTINSITSPSIADVKSGSDTATTSSPKPATGGIANTSTFLQLLVAQIKNQDPLKPTDGTAFLTQLAQFSQLEQLMGIRTDLEAAKQPTTDPAAGPVTDNQTNSARAV